MLDVVRYKFMTRQELVIVSATSRVVISICGWVTLHPNLDCCLPSHLFCQLVSHFMLSNCTCQPVLTLYWLLLSNDVQQPWKCSDCVCLPGSCPTLPWQCINHCLVPAGSHTINWMPAVRLYHMPLSYVGSLHELDFDMACFDVKGCTASFRSMLLPLFGTMLPADLIRVFCAGQQWSCTESTTSETCLVTRYVFAWSSLMFGY